MELDMTKVKVVKVLLVLNLFIFHISHSWAEDLKDIYELALKNDPNLKVAQASYKIGKEYKKWLKTNTPK